MRRPLIVASAAAVLLAACAAPSQPMLDGAIQQCAAGNQSACNAVPAWQSTVSREKSEQADKVGAAIVLGLGAIALGAAAGVAASQPHYYQPDVILVCGRWGC